jgi:hypothetical protein
VKKSYIYVQNIELASRVRKGGAVVKQLIHPDINPLNPDTCSDQGQLRMIQ